MPNRITHVTDCITHATYSVTNEMREIVRTAAQPVRAGELVKEQINRAARRLGLRYRRAETLWYGRPAQVLAHEADRLRAWRASWIGEQRRWHAEEMARLDAEERRLAQLLNAEEESDSGEC